MDNYMLKLRKLLEIDTEFAPLDLDFLRTILPLRNYFSLISIILSLQ